MQIAWKKWVSLGIYTAIPKPIYVWDFYMHINNSK